jgi:hypothetical protein
MAIGSADTHRQDLHHAWSQHISVGSGRSRHLASLLQGRYHRSGSVAGTRLLLADIVIGMGVKPAPNWRRRAPRSRMRLRA